MVASCDLRGVHGPVAEVAEGDGETHCPKVRSDKSRTDQVAEPSSDRVMRFYPSRSKKRPSTSDLPF